MTKCYVWEGLGGSNETYAFFLCTSGTPGWITGGSFPSGNYKLPAVNGVLAQGADGFYITPDSITECTSYNQVQAIRASKFGSRGDCNSCISNKSYNCVNGVCQEIAGTNGSFATLEACVASGCDDPNTSYNCVDGQCVPVNNNSGAFPTLAACQVGCRDEKKCCQQNTDSISGLQQRVNKLESTVQSLKSDIDRIKSENKEKKLGDENGDLAQRVGRIENYISQLDRELTTFKKQIDTLFKDVKDFGKYLIDFLKIILALFI